MKEQRERLVSNAVEANLGTVEGTQSRFVDMGFVSPVLEEPTDYAGNFINAVKAGTEAITSSGRYKTLKAEEIGDARINAGTRWAEDWKNINEMVDEETGLPFSPHQKQIAAARLYKERKNELEGAGRSGDYSEAYLTELATNVKNDTVGLFTQETKNTRENSETDWGIKVTQGVVTQEAYRTAMSYNNMSNATASANLLKFKTEAVKETALGFYGKQDAYQTHITELRFEKAASGVYDEKHKDVKVLMEEGKTFEEAKAGAIRLAIFRETKDVNPSLALLKTVISLKDLHMKGDSNTKLLGNLNTNEAFAAQKAIAVAVATQRQYQTIEDYDTTKISLNDMETHLTSSAIDGKALSTATKARALEKVQDVMDKDMADLWQGTSTAEGMSRLNNMLALNSGNKTITDRYKQAFSVTMEGLVSSSDIDVMSTLNYITLRVGSDRKENSAIWGLMDSMPRWQTAILAKEMGASANDLEMLVASFDEQDYDDNGIIRLQGVSKKQASAILEDADEIVSEMPIMQGDYKRYLNITATMMLIAERTGHVDKDLMKEQMLSASTYNVGTPLSEFGMKEGFRIPNSYTKSIALNAKAPSMVATATLIAVETRNWETLKTQFPTKMTHYYDVEGNVQERQRVDWGQVDTRWVQVAPGRFTFRIQSGDNMRDFDISDDLIIDNIKAAQQRATVDARTRERAKGHVFGRLQSEESKIRKIEYDMKQKLIRQKIDAKQAEAEAKGERGPKDKYGIVTEAIIEWFNEE